MVISQQEIDIVEESLTIWSPLYEEQLNHMREMLAVNQKRVDDLMETRDELLSQLQKYQ